ncbi:phosphatase PAP2 family protein [Streptomyces sp. NBC_00053]|uniref:phosphatase PAP2 family protein n=1 Tax=unclassified Streptomyces TaxID=2593676 RepID=UPI000F5B9C2C|nr:MULTISPECIES: phosphatase PAP2 family protein [unclassified Streptomyces]WSG49971.1 phosphatase PAP2 family protein [Streptomyces sp. NBC_01732]WSX00625.1 phosphatase PAP2 family protein [Streptomyces sp. NBC_00987]MCX4397567.1 phosphatase PAP2 family protein [Streptomyces sp. NBC_01767]MCX5099735.1 phosphatase PAP2 family protein [Streptomyces sp. NBC_00439]MCX5159281.1 phosphatase PAP2 family protein [Streptomyces sp. NBC_00305]
MRTDIFARLDREPEPPKIEPPRMSRHRIALFGGTLAFYLAIVIAVLVSSWLVTLDWKVMLFRPYQQWPEIHAFLDYYIVLGQRGPTATMVACWLGWRSWRQHTLRPLLTLGAALLLLNVTVGAVKIGLGRLGPHYATQIGSAELFAGGDIFPSGHTANAVVTWGILAYLATTPRARRYLSAMSAIVSLGVGLTTVYLGTHWLSDVLLGWAAGLLIMLGLPWAEPLITRAEAWIFAQRENLRGFGRPVPSVPVAAGGPRTVLVPQPDGGEAPAREPVVSAAAGGTGTRPRAHASHPAHVVRSERTPVTPVGSRRPPHADRTPRGGSTTPARPVAGG